MSKLNLRAIHPSDPFRFLAVAAVIGSGLLSAPPPVRADPPIYINELFTDPPSSGDTNQEYIELRGTPNQSLDNTFLVFIENEKGSTDTLGQIELLFDLNGRSIGTNGFLTLRQKNSPFTRIAPGTTDLVNSTSGSLGYGSGSQSSIGGYSQDGKGFTENSGSSIFLVKNNGGPAKAPYLGLDVDGGDNGLDNPNLRPDWQVIDQIGFIGKLDQRIFRMYSQTSFGAPVGTDSGNAGSVATEPGAQYVGTSFGEVEYMGRWGSSVGANPADWAAANITNNPVAGYTEQNLPTNGFPVSGPHAFPLLPGEIDHGLQHQVALEGTVIMNTIGRPNYPIPDGDLNQDGFVGQSDLDIVLLNWGVNNPSLLGYWLAGDPSGDGLVGQGDLDFVLLNWGAGQSIQTLPTLDAPVANGLNADFSALAESPWAAAVPEPASLSLLALGAAGLMRRRR